jgi:serine/threonine protein kinase/WD40 repeat protein
MALPPGSRLGPYEILAPLGAGGMGEVYRAKDPRLGREVAIKVLPSSFSADPDRLRRFEQEARAAGILNHPNITAVYDIGADAGNGAPYVVSELLEGETLRSALAGGRLSARRATDYALQIAHGLAAAHEKGIVHRDLKPENLFVTKDGRVKILDFGLAKLTHQEEGSQATNLPTATAGTEPGVVLGTLGYMAPEQVRGRPADARSDLFSFGAILYEMLSGRRAFHGDSAADTMSAILREDPPDLSATNQAVSPGLERIVRHCLEKNPEQRFHSAHDVAFALEALSQTSVPQGPAPAMRTRRIPPAAWLAAGLIFGGLAAYAGVRGMRGAAASTAADSATYRRLTNLPGSETWPSLSPDGQTLAFTHRAGNKTDVWLQRAGGRNPIDLTPDCDRNSYSPAFSPDGSLIAYGSRCGDGGLFVMGATGENSRRLTSFGSGPAWSPDGREILYATELMVSPYGRSGTSSIWAVELASGKTRKLSADFDGIQPAVSPHGLRVAYWSIPPGSGQRDILTLPYKGLAAGEKPVSVTQDAAVDFNPVWAPDGRSIFFLSNRSGAMNLWRIPVDEATGKPLGPAEPQTLPAREVGGLAFSRDGRSAAYVVRENTYSLDRVVFDSTTGQIVGKPEQILAGSQEMQDLDVAPDGSFIVFDSRGAAQEDLFLVESTGKNPRQITDDPAKDRAPSISPDGKRISFHSDRNGTYQIWAIGRDGSGLKPLSKANQLIIESHWSPDGRAIATNSGHDSSILQLNEKGDVERIASIPAVAPDEWFDPLGWTPDGKTLVGPVIRMPDFISQATATYSPGPGAAVRIVRGTERTGAVRRGTVLGSRFLLYLDGGVRIADFVSGEDRVAIERPLDGSFGSVACARTGGTCYLLRSSDNADIWQRTLPEPNK